MDFNHRPPAGQAARIPRLRASRYFLLRQYDAAGVHLRAVDVYRSRFAALADAAGPRAEGFHAFVKPVDREHARDLLQHGAGWDPTTVSSWAREVPGGVPRAAMRGVLTAIAVDGRNDDRLAAGVTLRELGSPTLADAWRVNEEAFLSWLEVCPDEAFLSWLEPRP